MVTSLSRTPHNPKFPLQTPMSTIANSDADFNFILDEAVATIPPPPQEDDVVVAFGEIMKDTAMLPLDKAPAPIAMPDNLEDIPITAEEAPQHLNVHLGPCPFPEGWEAYTADMEFRWCLEKGHWCIRRARMVGGEWMRRLIVTVDRSVERGWRWTIETSVFCGAHPDYVTANAAFVVTYREMMREFNRMVNGGEPLRRTAHFPFGKKGKMKDVALHGRKAALKLWINDKARPILKAPCCERVTYNPKKPALKVRHTMHEALKMTFGMRI